MSNKKQKKPVIENPTRRLIVVGSPRTNGRCAHLADLLFEACIEDCPTDEVFLAPVSELDIAGCVGCDWCKDHAWTSEAGRVSGAANDQAGGAEAEQKQPSVGDDPKRCCQTDDMTELYALIEDCDELVVVAPVYYAGPSSQLKALLDRLQPYFWNKALRVGRARRKPLTIHVVGEGGDPWGYEPLVTCIRSAFGAAGFRLERVLDWVGKIDEAGEITAEAKELSASAFPVAHKDETQNGGDKQTSFQAQANKGRKA